MKHCLKKGVKILLSMAMIFTTLMTISIDASANEFIDLTNNNYEILKDTIVNQEEINVPSFIPDTEQNTGSEKLDLNSNEGMIWTNKKINKISSGEYNITFYAKGFGYRKVNTDNIRENEWKNPLEAGTTFSFLEEISTGFALVGEPKVTYQDGIDGSVTFNQNGLFGIQFAANSVSSISNDEDKTAFNVEVTFTVKLTSDAQPGTTYSTGTADATFTPADDNYYYYTWGFYKSSYTLNGINWNNSSDGLTAVVDTNSWTIPDAHGKPVQIHVAKKFWSNTGDSADYTDSSLKQHGIEKLTITAEFTGEGSTRSLQLTIVVDYIDSNIPSRTFRPYESLGNNGGNHMDKTFVLGEVITKEEANLRDEYPDETIVMNYDNHAEILFKEVKEGALVLNKTAKWNGTDYTISLEAYTTGRVEVTTSSQPLDIVLVLDQSGSMASNNLGDIKRQQAMKNVVNSFIDDIVDNCNSNDVQHNIGIIGFNNNVNDITNGFVNIVDNQNELKNKINNLSADGQTFLCDAMQKALYYVNNAGNDGREKVVVVFSDGFPEYKYTNPAGWYDFQNADEAVSYAHDIKNSGAKIYCIGIFDGANSAELYGSNGAYGSPGEKGYRWRQRDNNKGEESATNRLLNYISSNSSNAENDGLKKIDSYPYYFEIEENWEVDTNAGYYLTAQDSTELSNVFKEISTSITTPSINLDSSAIVTDELSTYFKFSEYALDRAKVYSVDVNGNKTELSKDNLKFNPDTKTVTYTGFDFNANCVTDAVGDSPASGMKLLIEFPVEAESWFIGGNYVPTNTDNAGVKLADEYVEKFDIPYVDVDINYSIISADKAIYVGDNQEDILDKLFSVNSKYINEHAADYVNISYTYKSGNAVITNLDTTMLDDTTTYTITPVVTPKIYNGVEDDIDNITAKSNVIGTTSNLYILVPTIQTNDQTMFLGESMNLDSGVGIDDISWDCNDSNYNGQNVEILGQPELTWSYSLDNPFEPTESGDYEVGVVLANKGTSITVRSHWQHDNALSIEKSKDENGEEVNLTNCDDNHYYIRVIAGQITINKKIKDNTNIDLTDGDPIFTFKIERLDESDKVVETYYKHIKITSDFYQNHSVTINELPKGKYRITELDTLRYHLDFIQVDNNDDEIKTDGIIIDINNADRSHVVTYQNIVKSTDFDSDNGILVNKFELKDGKISVAQVDDAEELN